MTTSPKTKDLLTEAEQLVKELLQEATRLRIPHAYVADIKEMRKVIRIMRNTRDSKAGNPNVK
jgi:hypothetical protein